MIQKIWRQIKKCYIDDIHFFVSSGKFKLSYQIILFVISFSISWLFANFTSIDFYGNYLYIINIINFFSFLSFSGILSSINQSVASGYEYFYISGMKKVLKYSIIGSIGIFIFIIFNIFYSGLNIITIISLCILTAFFPISSALAANHFYLDGKYQFKKDFYYHLVILIIQNLLLFILIFYTQNLILYFLLLNIFTTFLGILIFRNNIKSIENSSIDMEKENKALKYGIFLTKLAILATFCTNINNVLIGLLFSPAALSFYIVGIGLPNTLLNVTKSSLSSLLSKYSQKESKLGKNFILFIIFGSIFLFILVFITLPIFLQILFPNYLDSITYGLIYSFLILIVPVTTLFGYYFRGRVDKKTIKITIIYPNIIKLVSFFPLIYFFKIYGIIFAEILNWILKLFLFVISINKNHLITNN